MSDMAADNIFAEARRIQEEAQGDMDKAMKNIKELQDRTSNAHAKEYLDGVLEMLDMERDAKERE